MLVALLYGEASAAALAQQLDQFAEAELIVHIAVYAELLAAPGMSQTRLDQALAEYQVRVESQTSHEVWTLAALAFRAYAVRRRKSGGGQPRRLLVDFLIGAHALLGGGQLMTLDPQHYRHSFPELRLISPPALP